MFSWSNRACIKVIRKEPIYNQSFKTEVLFLSKFCHENLPVLFGKMTLDGGYNCIIILCHLIHNKSYSIHSLLEDLSKDDTFIVDHINWKNISIGIARGLKYIHSSQKGAILHNDLKSDNVILDKISENFNPIIIDFGKACLKQMLDYIPYHHRREISIRGIIHTWLLMLGMDYVSNRLCLTSILLEEFSPLLMQS